ncbi:MAG TPA: CBS domain-containing protein [Balneolales bacterium]|nr:CBS domain-containing protein [Balneolales bacterium]
MLVKELLHTDYEPISSEETASTALRKMKNYGLENVPVIDQVTSKYLGLVSKKMMLEHTREEDTDILTETTQYPVKAYQEQHLFEAAGIIIRNDLEVLPIVDFENNYLGVLLQKEVYRTIMNMLNLTEIGSVLGIEVEQKDFVLSDIIRIIETEGAKVLGIAIETPTDTIGRVKISIKLNMTEVAGVTSSLRRHGFVITTESRDSLQRREYKERADEFMRYLEI